MLSSIFTVALLSAIALAAPEKRQATNAAQFTSAAGQLISQYIPSTTLPALISAISAGASAAKVTGDAQSLLQSALLASEPPAWFVSAVPAGLSTQIDALESNINTLRGTVIMPVATLVPVVIAVTTTDSNGNTVTSSITTTASAATGTEGGTSTGSAGSTTTTTSEAVSSGSGILSTLTTNVVSGVTSIFSTAVSGASSVTSSGVAGASSISSTAVNGASSAASTVVTSASSSTSKAGSGASSGAAGSSTSSAGASVPTAVTGAAAGVLGLVGMMIAL